MKIYKPAERFLLLSEVLKSCTKIQEKGKEPIFNTVERIMINQERGKLLSGDDSYIQDVKLEQKIQKISNN